jgi:MFS transporter, AAHS family, 4-hydroxybenzoate transporter
MAGPVGLEGTANAPTSWTKQGLAVVGLCFLINMVDGLDVSILSFIAPRIQEEWGIGSDTMGNLFSGGLLGMAIGGMLIAPGADKWGRRRTILIALSLMSVGMIASGFVQSVPQLFLARVVVGAGIGTVLATMAALAAEAAPAHHRSLAVGVVQAGYPFAAVFTGFFVAAMLPHWGWHGLLLAAGTATVALLPIAWLLLPTNAPSTSDMPVADAGMVSQMLALFSPTLRPRTIALWGAVFFGLMVLYFIVSWIPKLAIEAGLSETDGIYAGALYNLGAFAGTLLMSFLSIRLPLGRIVPTMLIAAAVAMMVFGSVEMSVPATLAVAFLIGVTLQGGYNGVWPLAAGAYPPECRATGVGWAIGIGRSGAILGPMIGGYLMEAEVSLALLFGAYCVPLVLCALCASLVERRPA